MTYRFDVAHDPAVAARWCALAEQRLDYLTELFQNGRWRRYYSHTAFLENIREAKAMVAHWRALSTPGYVPEEPAPILIPELKPVPMPEVVEAAPDEIHLDVASDAAPADEVAAAPAPEVPQEMPSTPDGVTPDHMNDRYSLLRNLAL